jgi:hypothetical protein
MHSNEKKITSLIVTGIAVIKLIRIFGIELCLIIPGAAEVSFPLYCIHTRTTSTFRQLKSSEKATVTETTQPHIKKIIKFQCPSSIPIIFCFSEPLYLLNRASAGSIGEMLRWFFLDFSCLFGPKINGTDVLIPGLIVCISIFDSAHFFWKLIQARGENFVRNGHGPFDSEAGALTTNVISCLPHTNLQFRLPERWLLPQ